jgi:hypothetical protein
MIPIPPAKLYLCPLNTTQTHGVNLQLQAMELQTLRVRLDPYLCAFSVLISFVRSGWDGIDINRRKNKEKRDLAIYSSKSSFRCVDNVTRTDPRCAAAVSGSTRPITYYRS